MDAKIKLMVFMGTYIVAASDAELLKSRSCNENFRNLTTVLRYSSAGSEIDRIEFKSFSISDAIDDEMFVVEV